MRTTDVPTTSAQTGPLTPNHGTPLGRVVTTELRKMLNTRSGSWLVASLVILALLATIAVITFAPDEQLTYATFVTAIGIPLSLVLPMIAILSVTSEWSQRTGLTTFTLVPQRGRVLAAKAIASVVVAIVSTPLAIGIGALGAVAGPSIAGLDPTWDLPLSTLLTIALGNTLGVLVGFTIAVLVRRSPAALVGYVVYQFLLPTLAMLLAASQSWFRDVQPWIDLDFAQNALFSPYLTAEQWAQVGVTALLWMAIPLVVGLKLLMRAEVK